MSELGGLLHAQAGVVRADQAETAGLPARTLRRWAAEGRWTRLHPGVYLAEGQRLDDEARVRAAWLWAGDRAAVGGPAAAWWHGLLPGAPSSVELVVPRHHHPRSRPGLRIRRRDLGPADVARRRGIALTALPLTVLDTALGVPDGAAFLDRALQRHVPFPVLLAAHRRAMDRPGSAELGRLLVAAADRAASTAERLLLRILRAAGITGWTLDHPFGPYGVDLVFLAERVAVEVDGWAWHTDHERFVRDRRKGNALVGAGWRLLRFTWHDLTKDPERVVADLRRVLARAA